MRRSATRRAASQICVENHLLSWFRGALALGVLLLSGPVSASVVAAPVVAAPVVAAPVVAAPVVAAPVAAAAGGEAAALKIETAAGVARPTDAAAKAEAAKLTSENTATKTKPKGFRYSVLRDVRVEEVGETLLYVKKNKAAKTSHAVPIPKDRALLATCIAGGTVKDLKRAAIITVRFDPAGVVRPEIIVSKRVAIEVLHGKVLDIGGPKLYIALDDHSKRGFAVDAYADWNEVVKNGDAKDLIRGAPLTVRFDPSGEAALEISLDQPGGAAKAPTDKGCGCSVTPNHRRGVPAGAVLFFGACGLLWTRRRLA